MKTEEEYREMYNLILSKLKTRLCIICSSKTSIKSESKGRLICTWKSCKKVFSWFNDTIFYNVKIDHILMIQILDMWSDKIPALLISNVLGIRPKITSTVLKKLTKRMLLYKYLENIKKVGRQNTIVEVDETKILKNKHHRGHFVEGVWCLGMVERSTQKKIIILPLSNRKKDTLHLFLKRFIEKDSRVYTDGWKGYNGLNSYFSEHKIVNHTLHFKDPLTGVYTNTVEGNWNGLKRQIPVKCRNKKFTNIWLKMACTVFFDSFEKNFFLPQFKN